MRPCLGRRKCDAARTLRISLEQSPDTTGYRCLNGESDGVPGLVLDRYGDTFIMKAYTAAWLPRIGTAVQRGGGRHLGDPAGEPASSHERDVDLFTPPPSLLPSPPSFLTLFKFQNT